MKAGCISELWQMRRWQEAAMAEPSDSTQIEYRLYVPSDADAMAKLLAETFTRHDPPAVATGLNAPEFESFIFCAHR